MSGRLNHQHAYYAWRREQEHNRVQATKEVNRYYDHWGQVTSRFENWTNKEYYDKAEQKLQTRKDQQQKQQELEARRGKLRQLLDTDNDAYDVELGRKRRPREAPNDLKTLERVNQTLKEQEQLKRKLEMEAKLYGRWRHGVDDEQLLYKSKSDNEVLAKLNWLDKQIAEQQKREEQEALAAERQLQLQQELSRTEETRKERELIREQEVKELRALQETHVSELKQRQQQAEKLKEEEQHFRVFLSELEKEKELLEESTALMIQQPDMSQAYNLKKIKIYIRNRSESFRKQISLCLDILERIAKYAFKPEQLQQLMAKYKEQLENEVLAYAQIEAMYESEAKYNLQRCEENWRELHLQRFSEINKFIEQEQQSLSAMLRENLAEQQSLVELRSTHLTGIEQTNKQLEQLNNQAQPEAIDCAADLASNASSATVLPPASSHVELAAVSSDDQLPKVTSSFSNLNLDVWQNMQAVHGGVDSPTLNKTRSMNVVTSQTAVPPKFARKRVAWT
ncbi:trichoplein keratin filament-binding protein [Drosophila busckii]|nr:trichoplein keratin filament-binding protein [Drosophila busckii]